MDQAGTSWRSSGRSNKLHFALDHTLGIWQKMPTNRAMPATGVEMMFYIDETTDRATLEEVAIVEIGFDVAKVEAASDDELRTMIVGWVMAGDECVA